MHLLVSLAALLGFEVEAITDRVKGLVIANAAMIVLGLVGVGFLIAAAFIALADALGPLYAALILAATFLILALAVYLGMKISDGRRHGQVTTKRRSSETSAFVTTAALTALPVLFKSPVIRTVGLPAAAIAAFLLLRKGGDKPD